MMVKKVSNFLKQPLWTALLLVSAHAVAGRDCDDFRFLCPGPNCQAYIRMCQAELYDERAVRLLEEQVALKKLQETYIPGEYLLKQAPSRPPELSAPLSAAPANAKPTPMPANAESDLYAVQGWSCKPGFRQEGAVCEKDASAKNIRPDIAEVHSGQNGRTNRGAQRSR